jgi:hypothetical protein
MIATIVRKGEAMPALPAQTARWLPVPEERIMPRFFIFTAIVVTLCAVATIIAAMDQAAFPLALAGR